MSNIAVIFAGGTGTRMGIDDVPKQFLEVAGKPIIIYTLEHFQNHPMIDEIHVVCVKEWIEYFREKAEKFGIDKIRSVSPGGTSGMDSIYQGLKAVAKAGKPDDIVLIHDGVRPFITEELITRNIKDTEKFGNSITSTVCNETFILSDNSRDVKEIPLRKESYNAQAPQAFRLGKIVQAHDEIREANPEYTDIVDCCTLMHKTGRPVFLTEGVRGNIKITNPVDIYIFEAWMEYMKNEERAKGIPADLSVSSI